VNPSRISLTTTGMPVLKDKASRKAQIPLYFYSCPAILRGGPPESFSHPAGIKLGIRVDDIDKDWYYPCRLARKEVKRGEAWKQ